MTARPAGLLIGTCDSQVFFGQSRVLLVWNRVIFPNGKSMDYHWGNLLKAAALSTLLGAGTEIGAMGNQNDIVTALRRGSQDTINQTGQQLVRRQLNVQPALTIRPGFPVRVIVNRDLVLAQYQG